MVLQHFLMVAPALVRRSCFNSHANHLVDLHDSPLLHRAGEQMKIFPQKVFVGDVFFSFPEGSVVISILG